jgi:hypothetical protein
MVRGDDLWLLSPLLKTNPTISKNSKLEVELEGAHLHGTFSFTDITALPQIHLITILFLNALKAEWTT